MSVKLFYFFGLSSLLLSLYRSTKNENSKLKEDCSKLEKELKSLKKEQEDVHTMTNDYAREK